MANVKIEIHHRNVEARLASLNNWNVPEEVKTSILDFLNDLELGKVNRGRKISKARQLKYLDMLKNPLEYWNKSIEDLDSADIESFEKDLTTDKIFSKRKKKPYSTESKRDIRIAVKIFLRWKLGEAKAIEIVGWLDTRRTNKTPEYLKESEVDKLYKSCKNAKERFLLAVLFDSGARAEEFLNVRYEDVEIPGDDNNFCRLTLKEEYSKTSGRVISLYWKYSLEAVRDYMVERESSGLKSGDSIFEGTYDSARFFLMRLGRRVLNKSIHFHLFRHSSATYYAPKLNRQELCYRYGWKFSSNMPDIYISRAGMESKELDEKFQTTEIEDLQKKLEIREREISIGVEQMQSKIKEEVWAEVENKLKRMIESGEVVVR
jgi:integrase/recombinase XerD